LAVIYPSTKRTAGLPMGELVLWYGMFAPKGRLKWDHGLGAVGLHFIEVREWKFGTRKGSG